MIEHDLEVVLVNEVAKWCERSAGSCWRKREWSWRAISISLWNMVPSIWRHDGRKFNEYNMV